MPPTSGKTLAICVNTCIRGKYYYKTTFVFKSHYHNQIYSWGGRWEIVCSVVIEIANRILLLLAVWSPRGVTHVCREGGCYLYFCMSSSPPSCLILLLESLDVFNLICTRRKFSIFILLTRWQNVF